MRCEVCLLVGCLTSKQQDSVSQGRICSDNFMCCHTEIEVADQTFYQSQYTDTGQTSPSADPITPGAWQGSHSSANFEVTGMTRPPKKSRRKRDSNLGSSALEADALPLGQRGDARPTQGSSGSVVVCFCLVFVVVVVVVVLFCFVLFWGFFFGLVPQHPSNMLACLGDGSAQAILRTVTLRWMSQIQLPTSSSHSILTPGQSVPPLTL